MVGPSSCGHADRVTLSLWTEMRKDKRRFFSPADDSVQGMTVVLDCRPEAGQRGYSRFRRGGRDVFIFTCGRWRPSRDSSPRSRAGSPAAPQRPASGCGHGNAVVSISLQTKEKKRFTCVRRRPLHGSSPPLQAGNPAAPPHPARGCGRGTACQRHPFRSPDTRCRPLSGLPA